mmetsp:Transcript_27318/g.68614  ORF Transcript_27318/g.68614 Transcript_27318/m.68614 type:complete len:213 (+) Transcript_27318:1145-1783(+)
MRKPRLLPTCFLTRSPPMPLLPRFARPLPVVLEDLPSDQHGFSHRYCAELGALACASAVIDRLHPSTPCLWPALPRSGFSLPPPWPQHLMPSMPPPPSSNGPPPRPSHLLLRVGSPANALPGPSQGPPCALEQEQLHLLPCVSHQQVHLAGARLAETSQLPFGFHPELHAALPRADFANPPLETWLSPWQPRLPSQFAAIHQSEILPWLPLR